MAGWRYRRRLEHALRSTGRRRYPEFDRTATLNNLGSISALSDRAVASTPLVINNRTIINNDGTITGFVQLSSGDNSIFNNNTFNLRHFADTTGGGRDTLRVAIADLGTGPNNIFTNNGTLALPAVTGATTLDSTGQYLPLGIRTTQWRSAGRCRVT